MAAPFGPASAGRPPWRRPWEHIRLQWLPQNFICVHGWLFSNELFSFGGQCDHRYFEYKRERHRLRFVVISGMNQKRCGSACCLMGCRITVFSRSGAHRPNRSRDGTGPPQNPPHIYLSAGQRKVQGEGPRQGIEPQKLTVYYSPQCPYIHQSVELPCPIAHLHSQKYFPAESGSCRSRPGIIFRCGMLLKCKQLLGSADCRITYVVH